MDERPNRFEDPDLPDRLRSWFASEVQQANVDLHRSTLRAVRTRSVRSRAVVGPASAVAIIAILIAAGASRLPLLTPGSEASQPPSPTIAGPTPSIAPTSHGPSPTPVAGNVGARYADGIPSMLDGESVLRPISVSRSAPGDDSSFLLGGWVSDFSLITIACPLIGRGPPEFGPRCGTPYVAETPTPTDANRILLSQWTAKIPAGPVVLRVHRHDRRSETCSPEARDGCESMAVIEAVAWTSDDVTAALPITAIHAVNRLVSADPSFANADLSTFGARGPEPFRSCVAPHPNLAWAVAGSEIDSLLVFPSTAAREAVDQDFNASGFVGTSSEGASSCVAIFDAAFSHTWVSGENVMVAVQTNVDGPTPLQAALIKAVREAFNGP